MAYAAKDHILAIMKFFRPTYDLVNISDDIQSLSTADIHAELLKGNLALPVHDISNLLRSAEICFYMEHMGMTREIENAFGVLKQETIGRYTKQYENGMPMFFFAQGASAPFLQLLPHETWRMRAYKYTTAFIEAWFQQNSTKSKYGCIIHDNTMRGKGWQHAVSDYSDTNGNRDGVDV
jgi:hypothetical protein